MGGMSEEREKRGGGCAVAFSVAAVLAMLTLLYVLSSGPAFIFLSHETWVVVYFPLLAIAACVPPFDSFMEWYVRLWIDAA